LISYYFQIKQLVNNDGDSYNIKETDIALQRIGLSTLFHMMIPGPKMYWQFGDLGYDVSINWPSGTGDDRLTPKPPKWDYQDSWRRMYLHKLTSAVNKLKAENDAWETNGFQIDVYGAIKKVTLRNPDMNVVAVGNFDVVARDIEVDFPNIGIWYNYFDGQVITVESNGKWSTNLAAGGFYLLCKILIGCHHKNFGIFRS